MISFRELGDYRPRKRFRPMRALFMLLAFGFNLVVVTGAILYLLNDDHYRKILIWSADQYLDTRLEINGEFSIEFGRVLKLIAEDVQVQAIDGSYELSLEMARTDGRRSLLVHVLIDLL